VNAVFFVLLIISILAALFKVFVKSSFLPFFGNMPNINHIFSALPILFTSFGVQNVCPNVYDFLEKNPRKAKKAFLVGIVLAGVIYMSWIYVVLNSIYSTDPVFYEKMLGKNLNSGDLINKICEISGSKITHILLTSLSLLAIVTSAIGMAVGISVSLKEILKEIFKKYIPIITAALPTIAVLLIPNAFMNILAFGGMIATIFVIFLPIYLYSLLYKERKYDIKNILCVLFAIMVIYGELLAKN
jgi:tyrosine-specific transport protein